MHSIVWVHLVHYDTQKTGNFGVFIGCKYIAILLQYSSRYYDFVDVS